MDARSLDRWKHHRCVTLLRPEGASEFRILQDDADGADYSTKIGHLQMQQQADRLRILIEKTASNLQLRLQVHECIVRDVFERPSLHDDRWINRESDVLALLNPREALVEYLTACMRHNPSIVAILAYDHRDALDEFHEQLASLGAYLVSDGTRPTKRVSRVFPLSIREEREADTRPIRSALEYHHPAIMPPLR